MACYSLVSCLIDKDSVRDTSSSIPPNILASMSLKGSLMVIGSKNKAHQCHIDEKTCSHEVTLRTCGNPAGGLAPDFEVFTFLSLSVSLSSALHKTKVGWTDYEKRDEGSQGRGGARGAADKCRE